MCLCAHALTCDRYGVQQSKSSLEFRRGGFQIQLAYFWQGYVARVSHPSSIAQKNIPAKEKLNSYKSESLPSALDSSCRYPTQMPQRSGESVE